MESLLRGLVGTQHVQQCFCCRHAIEANEKGILRCGFCPKSYHYDCLPNDSKPSITSKSPRWGCPSHKCQCALPTSAMKKREKMLTCVTCPRSYCLKCIGGEYEPLERSKIWNKMSARYAPIQCSNCIKSGVDLGGFFSSDFATEDPKSDSGSQLKDTSLREQIVEFIQKNRVKQEDVAKAINSSAGTLSLYLKGDTRKRGWGNLEEKLTLYLETYELESKANSDQNQNINDENNSRLAVPRDVYSNEEREDMPHEDSFSQILLNPDHHPYMGLQDVLSNEDSMEYQDEHGDTYSHTYHHYSATWSYSDADPSNTNLGIQPMSYNNSKADTDQNTDSMDDGAYPY